MPVLTADQRREADAIIARYPEKRSAMLPLLYLVQSAEGYLTREGLQEVGDLLDLRTAEVEAVATFYTMFRMRPTGRYVVAVCTNVSCALLGAKRLYERAHEALGPDAEEVTADGAITLHEEECLGACEQAPLVQVNWLNYARMTEASMADLLDRLRGGDPPPSTQGPVPADLQTTCRILAGLGTPAGWNGAGAGADPGRAPAADHGAPPPEAEGSGLTAAEPQVDSTEDAAAPPAEEQHEEPTGTGESADGS
jgi:NADH-quinone oxidoreductase subunit E